MKFILALIFLTSALPVHAQWVQTGGPSAGPSEMAFNSKGDIFDLAGFLLRSTDDGGTWKDITPDFLRKSTILGWGIAHDNLYFYFSNSSLYCSTDKGDSWTLVFKTPKIMQSFLLSKTGAVYFFSPSVSLTPDTNVFLRSLDDGKTWENLSRSLPSGFDPSANIIPHLSVMPTGELILSGYQINYIYYSTDKGDSWTKQSTQPFRLQTSIQGTSNGYLFCGTAILDSATDISNAMAIRSTDNGKTWDSIKNVMAPIISSNDIIGFTDSDSLMYSEDYGNTWNGYPLPSDDQLFSYQAYPDLAGNIYWSTSYQTVRYSTKPSHLETFLIPIAVIGNILVRGNGVIAFGNSFISFTDDRGKHWQPSETANVVYGNNYSSPGFAIDSGGDVIAISPNGFYTSPDTGKSWKLTTSFFGQNVYYSNLLASPDGKIFASGNNTIGYSSDNGKTWQHATAPAATFYSELVCDKSAALYAVSYRTIYRSNDDAVTWDSIFDLSAFLPGTKSGINSFAINRQGEMYVGTSKDGIIRSPDLGVNWKLANEALGSADVYGLFAAPNGSIGAFITGGLLPDGIVVRPYYANHWYSANAGLPHGIYPTTMAFAPDGTAYLGTNGEGVWRSDGNFSAVKEEKNKTLSISLSPNPSSDKIEISYSLAEAGYINLALCDQLGRKVKLIARGIEEEGDHTISEDLRDLPAGIYFLHFKSSLGSSLAKVLLVK